MSGPVDPRTDQNLAAARELLAKVGVVLVPIPPDCQQSYNQPATANRWGTIRYGIDSTARTVRLCAIILVTSSFPCLLALLIRH